VIHSDRANILANWIHRYVRAAVEDDVARDTPGLTDDARARLTRHADEAWAETQRVLRQMILTPDTLMQLSRTVATAAWRAVIDSEAAQQTQKVEQAIIEVLAEFYDKGTVS
jgi:hypothetical protein